MEIFNSIWTALSTPNIGLVNIILIPISIIEAIITMHLFLNIIGLDSTPKQRILYVLSICFISNLTTFIIPNPFNIYINYIFMILYKKDSYSK